MSNDEQNVSVVGMNEVGIYSIGFKTVDRFGKSVVLYDVPFTVPENLFDSYIKQLVNNPESPYYYGFDNRFIYKIGVINQRDLSVHLSTVPDVVNTVEYYQSKQLRQYHQTLLALNTMPKGYYKMSVEQKQEIQERIDNAIIDYVNKYVFPDIDFSKIDKNGERYKSIVNDVLQLSSDVKS